MASSLFARVPALAERDQHEMRFVLQVISLWPDLRDDERVCAFQRRNVYCIVAALGWPAATATCASSTATTDLFSLREWFCLNGNSNKDSVEITGTSIPSQQLHSQQRQQNRCHNSNNAEDETGATTNPGEAEE